MKKIISIMLIGLLCMPLATTVRANENESETIKTQEQSLNSEPPISGKKDVHVAFFPIEKIVITSTREEAKDSYKINNIKWTDETAPQGTVIRKVTADFSHFITNEKGNKETLNTTIKGFYNLTEKTSRNLTHLYLYNGTTRYTYQILDPKR